MALNNEGPSCKYLSPLGPLDAALKPLGNPGSDYQGDKMLTLSATSTSVVASWDTQQRLSYNPNAPRRTGKKPSTLALSPTSQATGNATLAAPNVRPDQIVSDLLKRRSPSPIEGKFMVGFLISFMGFWFSAWKFEVSSVSLMGELGCWRIQVFIVVYAICSLVFGNNNWTRKLVDLGLLKNGCNSIEKPVSWRPVGWIRKV